MSHSGYGRYVVVRIATGVGAAEHWRSQYGKDDRWTSTTLKNIYEALCALGPNPDIAAVARATGNQSWSYLFCDGCHEYVDRAVEIGEYDPKLLCASCLRGAAQAMESGEPNPNPPASAAPSATDDGANQPEPNDGKDQ